MNKSSRNSFVLDLDMGRGRSGLGRPLCGGAARPPLLLCIKRIFFMLEANIKDRELKIVQTNHHYMLKLSVKLNFQNWTSF